MRSNRQGAPRADWVVVGGGIHGVHVALRLLAEKHVTPEQLRVIDPGHRLLSRWRACTQVTGMAYLRSPAVHNLGATPQSLLQFAGKRKDQALGLFAAPYQRPEVGLFQAHCDQLIERSGLERLHVQDRVHRIRMAEDAVHVSLALGGEWSAGRVVLALGASDEPHWPTFALRDDPGVHHVFEPGFSGWPSEPVERVAVVGGGITAAQVAIRLGDQGHQVRLVSRHALREHQFDSEPGWLGPKLMAGFLRTRDLTHRRAMIAEARHRGSLPPDVRQSLRSRVDGGRVRHEEARVTKLVRQNEELHLTLDTGDSLVLDRVLLATGFTRSRPGGPLIDELIRTASLPCAPCGYPIVDSALRWHPRIHVTGPLAELELGPAARNISGAQRAGERILRSLGRSTPTERLCPETLPAQAEDPAGVGMALA